MNQKVKSHISQIGISIIHLNRPKSRNALGKQLVDEFYEAIDELQHSQVRVVIIKSEVEGVFCSGADLKERAQMTKQEGEAFVNKLRSLFNRVEVNFYNFKFSPFQWQLLLVYLDLHLVEVVNYHLDVIFELQKKKLQ